MPYKIGTGSGRRDLERIFVLAPVSCENLSWVERRRLAGSLDAKEIHGVAIDVSPDGVFIQSKERPEENALVAVDMDFLQLGSHAIASGKIVRQDASGFAVKFDTLCNQLYGLRQV